jgi:hypothetical protein
MGEPRLWLPLPYSRKGEYTDTLSATWAAFYRNGNWRASRAMVEVRSGFWSLDDAKAWITAEIKRLGE